jgi:hypothetical protein
MEGFSIIPKPHNALHILPDDTRYKCRFEVRSSSSDRVHRISFDAAPGAGYWMCSCPGAIRHGSCKHLEAAGLRGRKFGRDQKTIKMLQNAGVL